MRTIIATVAALVVASSAFGDSLVFGPDRSLDCIVLQDNGRTVTVLHDYSVLRFSRADVQVVKDSSTAEPSDRTSESASRLPNYTAILIRLGSEDWATDLRQIPATVIDNGVMRNVPYKSHRVGGNYEMNVYGDPSNPAGFEIGIRGKLLDDEQAKKNCMDFIASLLSNTDDKAILHQLKLDKDLKVRENVTFEITPSTAEDAYGGWWVSVYSEPQLDKVRASDKELKAITVSKTAASTPTTATSSGASGWTSSDLGYARPSRSKTHGDDVYVRGYYRKDGTYVQSYTRSAPHSKY